MPGDGGARLSAGRAERPSERKGINEESKDRAGSACAYAAEVEQQRAGVLLLRHLCEAEKVAAAGGGLFGGIEKVCRF